MHSFANKEVDLILFHIPSLRFNLSRFCVDIKSRVPGMPLFFLLGKGMRLDQFPHADGYLRQPFTQRQLLSRLARVLPEHVGEIVAWKDLRLDTESYLLMWQTKQIPLTPKQAALILAFLRRPEETLSRAQLMQEVWGTDYLGDTRTLDVHIHWLRKSLKQLQSPFVVRTLRGKGYQLVTTQSQVRGAKPYV
jgi:DNA-binding response OmpR family regulator